ncbi:MAG: LacI family DNA-binding transcriptional regulator [Kiloniellales bacterium]|nr:LacI family DNA-binding transcriptional regulator [Kiloniellales bacterium]
MLEGQLQVWQRSHREPSASLVDVARRAKASPTTVSRFFNQPDLVRPGTRQRIERAVAELGYLPNAAARALASRRSRRVGVVDQDGGHPGVGIDNRAAGRRIAAYLLDLGHSDFGVISAEIAQNDRARQRLAGVREAREARGGTAAPGSVEDVG